MGVWLLLLYWVRIGSAWIIAKDPPTRTYNFAAYHSDGRWEYYRDVDNLRNGVYGPYDEVCARYYSWEDGKGQTDWRLEEEHRFVPSNLALRLSPRSRLQGASTS
jgi:hypothetical protein